MKGLFILLADFLFLFARRLVYFFFWFSRFVFVPNPVVVLCYHSVGVDSWRYTVSLEMLRNQLELLMKTHKPVSLYDIYAYARNEITFASPVFAVTFDDGYADVMQTVDLFQSLGITPAVFVLSDPKGVVHREVGSTRAFLDTSMIRYLHSAGWIIGCHSATHPDFSRLSGLEMEREILLSKCELERRLGFSVEYFAYPKGRYSADVIAAVAQAGYKAAFSMDDRIIVPGIDLYTLPRVGVDHSHTLFEFSAAITPAAVYFRSFVKSLLQFLFIFSRVLRLFLFGRGRLYAQ